ncbi:MAG: response regulator [Lentisphaeria bacterium]|nr:response regulator [Lentisphaeria bacterium]
MALVLVLPLAVSAGGNTVKVGYYENEVFQEGAWEGAAKTGYAYEYYRKLSEYTGWKYEYVYGKYADLYKMLLEGRIDFLAGLAWKEERRNLIGYPDAPMGKETYNLVKHHSDNSINADLTTLEGKTIGVLDSALADALRKFLAEKHVTAKIRLYKDYTALFADFDAGKLDVLAAEGSGAYGRYNTEELTSFGSADYFLCVSIKRPDLLKELNAAQSALALGDPNFLNRLNLKYYPKTISARVLSSVEKQWLATHRTLRVGFFENYMPYSGKDTNGQVTGIVKDIFPELLASLGVSGLRVTYSGYLSYDATISDIAAGRIDVAFPVGGSSSSPRESGLYRSVPVTSTSTELVYKGAYTEKTMALFAINKDNRMQYNFIVKLFPKSKVTLLPSIDACLDAVLSGDASCTTLNGLRANYILKDRRYKSLSLHQLGRNDDRFFGVGAGNEGLLRLLNRGLNVLGSDYAQNKSHHYMYALASYRLVDVFLDHLGLFGSLLTAVAAVIIALLVRDRRRTRLRMAEKEAASARLAETNRKLMEHTETIEKQRLQEFELREQLEKKQDELEDALQMTQAANRAKTTFLSNMSHDIRTPMNAIIGFTRLAENHIDDTERVRDCLATIKQSSEHLLLLINDVLDMSRIESGRIVLNEKEESLADILHGVQDIVLAEVRAKRQSFFVDVADVRDELIFCDRLYLNRVLLNLISNAIKYTPQGGTISVRIREVPGAKAGCGSFEFRVKDNGIGMSEEFLTTIFDPFTREENSTVSGIQGTGLGMTITKNIVETMGGKIAVATKKGEGTEFVVSLEFRLPEEASSDPVIPELKGARGLVVSGDGNGGRRIAGMLRELGLRSEWSSSCKDAAASTQEALRQGDPFKVIIADSRAEDADGMETARTLRFLAGEEAAIFVLNAYDSGNVRKAAREAGVTGFIPQTLFLSDLKKALLAFCGKTSSGQAEEEKLAFSLKGKKILMVDDSKLNLKIGVLLLQEQGMIVDTASNGQLAVEKIREKGVDAYDFILMDVQMPVMGGYEATGILRKLPGGEKLKIIAFSANAFEEDREKSLKAGMDGHITKPLKMEDLIKEFAGVSIFS